MQSTLKVLSGLAFAIALVSGPASAGTTVLMSENFDAENGGQQASGFTNFTQFNVVDGNISLFGVGGPNDGLVVALGAANGHGGALRTKATFDFLAGDIVTISTLVGGTRDAGGDTFFLSVDFAAAISIEDMKVVGYTPFAFDAVDTINGITVGPAHIDNLADFSPYTFSFRAKQNGSLDFLLAADSFDDPGPLIDNVTLAVTRADVAGVPEPSSWALLLVGFGGAGAMIRGRRRMRFA